MNANIAKTLISLGLVGCGTFTAVAGCSAEDPATSPTTVGNTTSTTAAQVTNTTGGATNTVAGTTGTPVTSATSAGPVTSAGTTGITATGATATTSTGTTGGVTSTVAGTTGATVAGATVAGATVTSTTGDATTAATTGATTGSATTGGNVLTECSGIGDGDACPTPGVCPGRPCGIADTGSRDCTCTAGLVWDCSSCAWTMPYDPLIEPPAAALPACSTAAVDAAACTPATDMRCMQGAELCVCYDDDGTTVWDCDDPPSFWP